MAEKATAAMDQMLSMLSEGVDPPASLITLKQAVSSGDNKEITKALYSVLIDQTLDYDVTEEGMLVNTKADYSKPEEDELVKEKMMYIYGYGITMFKRGFIEPEPLKELVEVSTPSRLRACTTPLPLFSPTTTIDLVHLLWFHRPKFARAWVWTDRLLTNG